MDYITLISSKYRAVKIIETAVKIIVHTDEDKS